MNEVDVGSVRAIWAVQDKLALNAEEEKAIELNREVVGGQERTVWNPLLSFRAKEFDFTDAEVAWIKAAVQTWHTYGAAVDRHWLEPLIEVLLSPEAKP